VTSALCSLHWLPIKQRIQFKLCLLVNLALNGRAPCYLAELLALTVSVPGRASLRSATNHDLIGHRTRLKFGERAFAAAGPAAWNGLPTELKTIADTKLFKCQLKTFLFKQAYQDLL